MRAPILGHGDRPGFRLAAGMTWRRWLIDLVLIAGGVVSVVFEPFSIAIHGLIGLAFVGTVGPHLWHRRDQAKLADQAAEFVRCAAPS
jgi:hypothetical protein